MLDQFMLVTAYTDEQVAQCLLRELSQTPHHGIHEYQLSAQQASERLNSYGWYARTEAYIEMLNSLLPYSTPSDVSALATRLRDDLIDATRGASTDVFTHLFPDAINRAQSVISRLADEDAAAVTAALAIHTGTEHRQRYSRHMTDCLQTAVPLLPRRRQKGIVSLYSN